MNHEQDARIKGRINLKAGANPFYPKFVVHTEKPFVYSTIHTKEDLDNYTDETVIYEPIRGGLGISRRVLYVPTSRKTYLFLMPLQQFISWGDNVITFSESITFADS